MAQVVLFSFNDTYDIFVSRAKTGRKAYQVFNRKFHNVAFVACFELETDKLTFAPCPLSEDEERRLGNILATQLFIKGYGQRRLLPHECR